MELLEGETLSQRLTKGPLPISEVLRIGIAVAEALEAAHRQGIVHRDLKPGNVMLTKSGAKLMDFGLAKSTAAGLGGAVTSAPLLSAAKTMSEASPMSPLTTAGAIIGTIQYMSPEQIEGKEADGRSDLFALGAVLYEMVTGGRPFAGKSQISVASAILEKDPEPISAVQPLTPPALEHIIDTCLAKDPEDRFQTAHDVRLQLKWIAQGANEDRRPIENEETKRGNLGWIAAGALAVVLIASLAWWRSSIPAEQITYFFAPLPFSSRDVAVSPNGHTVAVVGYRESERKSVLWIYEVGSPAGNSLPNTEGANFPFWSPDGKSLGFFADGKLKKLDVAGGPVQTLCDARSGRGGTWNKDGVILFTPSGQMTGGLQRISASGGPVTSIAAPQNSAGEASQRWPMFLPDGKHYLFLSSTITRTSDSDGIYVGQLDSTETQLVVKTTANAAYAAPGYLLFC